MERITMPQLGETVTEGTITRWLKAEGELVQPDESLFEVSTDKVDTEVPSAHGGYLRRILVAAGETVPIHTVLALVTETADEPLEERQPATVGPPASAAAPSTADAAGRSERAGDASPVGARPPGRRGRHPRRDGTASTFLSPAVRQLLDERGLDPTHVVGSGRDGRITRADVLAAAANRSPGVVAPATTPVHAGLDDEIVPFSKARSTTAAHMVRSRATSAHALLSVEVDYGRVDEHRRAAALSYLPFVARAVVDALADHPHLNASVGDDALIVHRRVHLGIAVDLHNDALVVPVVHEADTKRLIRIADDIAELAAGARAHRLSLDDLAGATFTLTNVGSYGTVSSAPIINQPQVAILSVDGIKPRPVATTIDGGEWAVTVRPVGNLSLAFDHRAVDGAYAASFLARVREVLETRDWSAEL